MVNLPLKDKKLMAIMRHENSLSAVWGFVSGLGMPAHHYSSLVMERHIDTPEDFEAKKNTVLQSIKDNRFDVLVLASKINDVDSNSQLVPFLDMLRGGGIGQKPVIITHLVQFTAPERAAMEAVGLNLTFVEDDNLGMPKAKDAPDVKRTGMSKLGPAILRALGV